MRSLCVQMSWIVLHEVAHVHHGDSKPIPAHLQVRREYRADSFATDWILGEAGRRLMREFRVLMITVALTWLFLNERAVDRGAIIRQPCFDSVKPWGGSTWASGVWHWRMWHISSRRYSIRRRNRLRTTPRSKPSNGSATVLRFFSRRVDAAS